MRQINVGKAVDLDTFLYYLGIGRNEILNDWLEFMAMLGESK